MVILISNSLNIIAQSARYTAFNVVGKVQVKQEVGWIDVTKSMPLGTFDEVKIDNKGTLEVLETKTNAIYKSYDQGNMTVYQLIKNAKSQSEKTITGLTQAFINGMSTKKDNVTRLKKMGGVHRTTNSDLSVEDSICSTIAYIANLLLKKNVTLQDSIVTGIKIYNQDTYIIKLDNNTDLAYCINIVLVNRNNKTCRLLLSPGYSTSEPYIILDAQTNATLSDISYLTNLNDLLFVFASDQLFDNDKLNLKLEGYPLDNGNELIEMHYFEIK